MERALTNEDIRSMSIDYKSVDRRSGKDRRVAINSVIDPALDRRKKDRRK